MTKIFITGKNGQLGSQLINDINLLNYDVISYSKQELNINNNKKFYELLKKDKPGYVINCAAYNMVNECEISKLHALNAFETNYFAVKNMAEICQLMDIKFITFSSDYVFDGNKGTSYIETDKPYPLNNYGMSKLNGEYASLIYDNTTVIRTCGLYGLHSTSTKNSKGNFVDNRIADSKTSTNFILIRSEQIVSPTFVNDLSKAVLDLIHLNQSSNYKLYHIYHIVNEGTCSWYEFTKEIYNILNIKVDLQPINRTMLESLNIKNDKLKNIVNCYGLNNKTKIPLFSALENDRAKKLGIKLPHWKDALKRYLKLKYIS